MKILVLLLAAVFMVGCASTDVKRDIVEVKVPVYVKPKVQKIKRPELISEKVDSGQYDTVVKAIKVDIESLKVYSLLLENQLDAIVEYTDGD